MQELKLQFIQEALRDYMTEVISAMRKRIDKFDAKDSLRLLHSISYDVYQQYAEGEGKLSFAEWGRFIDMGVGKSHPLAGIEEMAGFMGAYSKKDKIRKPKKIYSPVVYGKLNGLIGDLAFGFTEETIHRLKAALTNGEGN